MMQKLLALYLGVLWLPIVYYAFSYLRRFRNRGIFKWPALISAAVFMWLGPLYGATLVFEIGLPMLSAWVRFAWAFVATIVLSFLRIANREIT